MAPSVQTGPPGPTARSHSNMTHSTSSTIKPSRPPLSRNPTAPSTSKPPNSRPPTGFREKILSAPLPHYSGPYSVGMMDIEVPAQHPRVFSNIKRQHRHLLELETVLFSVYYPSAFGSGAGKSPDGQGKWSRPTWLPRPRIEVAKGYGRFGGLPAPVTLPFFAMTTAFTKIPAWRNAELAKHWPHEKNAREGGLWVKNVPGKPPPGEPAKPTFPLLIFSHGLGGTRTTYSTLCGEFASYGFIVVALEHRDGSGPRTFINIPPSRKDASRSNSSTPSSSSTLNSSPSSHTSIPSRKERDHKKGYSKMDYVFPEGNKMDTAPGNEKGVDAELRAAQIQLRLAEIEEAYHVLTQIHAGDGAKVEAANLRNGCEGAKGGSRRALRGIDWAGWKGRFHLEQVTMIGHSFGAATTVEVLRHKDRFTFIGQGIIYDIWGAAIQPPEEEPQHRIHTPLLGINSEAFVYWPDNFKSVMQLCKEAKDQEQLCWLMTVRGSIHVSQSDFSILYPHISSWLLKMAVNPRRAIDLNINASLEFLRAVMPTRISAMNRGTNEHLLEVSMLDELPEEHRPDQKWTAVRLRIPHELRMRMTPLWIRKREMRRRIKKNVDGEGEEAWRRYEQKWPKDERGRALVGLQDLGPGEEVWMHVAPTKEELERSGLEGLEVGLEEGGEGESEGGMVNADVDVGTRGPGGTGGADMNAKSDRGEGEGEEHEKGLEQRYMERG